MFRACGRASNTYAANVIYRPTRETGLSNNYLVQPKDKDPKEKKSGVSYYNQCPAIDCGDEHIGETSRTLEKQCKEYPRELSPIQVHRQLTGHQTTPHNFNILGREGQDLTRLIKEAIFIRISNPTLNKNIGKFQLSYIWDRVLFSTPNLKVPFPQGNVQHSP